MENGRFTLLWLKYAAVLHVLLKKTDTESQKLQIYKHELDFVQKKQKINVLFSIDLIQGRAVNISATSSIAYDLWQVLDNRSATKKMLKERKIRVALNSAYQLEFEKIQENPVADTEITDNILQQKS
jgi:hypothetical protein